MMLTRFASLPLACGLFACGTVDNGGDGGGPPPFTNGASTLAGASDPAKTDGPRAVARFNNPVNVAVGPDGNIYVADFDNSEIRVVDRTGTTSTVIAKQGFVRPFGLAFGHDGTLYVSTDNDDTGGHTLMSGTVWRVDVHAKAATVIVRGIGRPRSLAVRADGTLVLADDLHHVVRTLNPSSGALTTIAGAWDVPGFADGPGASARFSSPYGVGVRGDGTIVLTDYDNQRIRMITPQNVVSTIAGTGQAAYADGPMTQAGFSHPQAMALAPSGDLYLTDTGNYRIRRISGTSVTTIAGDGNAGYLDDDDPTMGEFYGLEGNAVAPDGTVFVADGNRGDGGPFNRVRQVEVH